ncbi:MAG: ATP-binding protein [Pseudomonadota bacterium]
MRSRTAPLLVALIALALTATSSFADHGETLGWLDIRQTDSEALLEIIDANNDEETVIRARLTLADRAMNQSIDDVALHLGAAEALIKPGSDASLFALAVRCQLEHRQGLSAADASCDAVQAADDAVESALVKAYLHWTLSYFNYREGDHEQSLAEAERVLDLVAPLGDHDLLAAANNMVGLHFSTQFRPRMSVTHFETALEHAREMTTPEFRRLIQMNLASSYTYLGFGKKSINLLREVESTSLVELYPTRQLVMASMIAQASVAEGDLDGTEEALMAVIADVQDRVLPDGMTFGYTGLAIVQLADGRPEDALFNFDRVLEITGHDFSNGLTHPRIQLIAVPYAVALREVGRLDESRSLLETVVATVPESEPDQLLLSALTELATTLQLAGDRRAARTAAERAARIQSVLWDENFRYRIARLNVSLELDQQKVALALAQAREATLQAVADQEAALKRQSWLLAALVIVALMFLFSRLMQSRIASTERAANERLEGLVDERTQALSDEMAQRLEIEVEQRRLSEQLAEGEKMRLVGQLTAGVAHDFNNLMSIVGLAAENLKFSIAKGDDNETEKAVNEILCAAGNGAKITAGLLAYVRKQPLRPEVVALDDMLRDALPIFRNTLTERVNFITALDACHVRVDTGQLTTAILNLVLNARDAMPDGGSLTLALVVDDNTAEIRVTDTGRGMTEETRKRSFEPFFSTKDAGGGTGLGLSMVYGFARQSGGDLKIESALDQGTCVSLSLPLVAPEQLTQEATPRRFASDGSIRVLAIEDREFLLAILERTLKHMGLKVDTAPNADAALQVIESQGLPDLLISDVMMPGSMDGPDFAAMLRERKPELPVLLISGYTESVDPAFAFLRKPFSMTQLEDAISEVLKQPSHKVQ